MPDFPVFVQTPRQLFNLALAQLDVVQRPPVTRASSRVKGGGRNTLTDSYEFLTECWDELLRVARVAARLREGDDLPGLQDEFVDQGNEFDQLPRVHELQFAGFYPEAHDLGLSDIFDPDSQFRILARDFLQDTEPYSDDSSEALRFYCAARWVTDATTVLATNFWHPRRASTLADVILAFDPLIGTVTRWSWTGREGSLFMFDIEGIAWWADVLSLPVAPLLNVAATHHLMRSMPVQGFDCGDATEVSSLLEDQDAIDFLERFFEERSLWSCVTSPRRKIDRSEGQARVVTHLPDWVTDEDLNRIVARYAECLMSAGQAEKALGVLSNAAEARTADQFAWTVDRMNNPNRLIASAVVLAREDLRQSRESLRLSGAYVRGVLDERRRRGDVLQEQTVQLLSNIMENQEREREQREATDRQILRIRDTLERGLPPSWEASMRIALAEAMANRDWDKAADQLLRRGASGAAKERLDQRFGDRWLQLGRDSRDNLQALEILMADYVQALSELATIGLFRVFEPELRAALVRKDVAVAGQGFLKDMVAAAASQPAGTLKEVGTRCIEEDASTIRNAAAHGGVVSNEQFQTVKALLLNPMGGLLWRLLEV